MTDLDDALADLGPYNPSQKYSYTKCAEKYGVNRSTLSRRHRGKCRDKKRDMRNNNTSIHNKSVSLSNT
ncbi:hypothetical protein BU25DRAFT_483260 [Macroventuria anomochaeta]|uniref:Uncharacterized protein n=1 Tax=Macroventuria anomochaeta TaxID=301207 RepID=A0ACB6RIU2_9PLEO|nr:uncharacterized protein BU25DRAFT_483260 [Macroventuria anomochaeta]KAF2621267.1 hypothetical protein BU25DRAFT_483260 [Macroventuria anomochaeta]